MTVTVDALKETAPGETPGGRDSRQCAATEGQSNRCLGGTHAGAGALLPARTYTDVGARVDDAEQLVRRADAVLAIHAPDARGAHSCVGASSSADCYKLAQQSSSSPHSTMPASSR